MGFIVRPTKLGGGTDVVSGNKVKASEWNGDINTAYSEINGNLDSSNIKSSGAGIKGTQLASAPDGVATVNLNDGSVSTAKIIDAAVTTPKVLAASLGEDKLKITIHSKTVSINTGTGVTSFIAHCYADDTGVNWTGRLALTTEKSGAFGLWSAAATPTSSFPKATYDLIGIYVKNPSYADPNVTATVVYIFIQKT